MTKMTINSLPKNCAAVNNPFVTTAGCHLTDHCRRIAIGTTPLSPLPVAASPIIVVTSLAAQPVRHHYQLPPHRSSSSHR